MNLGSRNLLFVDDNSHIAEGYVVSLPTYGYNVTAVHTGADGLSEIAKTQFDIILLDMNLPSMTGEDIFLKLQSEAEYEINRETPVAIFTGYPEEETRLRLLDMGVVAYLVKPFDPKALASVMDNMLESDRRRRLNLELSRQVEELHQFNTMVINAMPSGMMVLDPNHIIMMANTVACETLRKDLSKIRGKSLSAIFGEQASQKMIAQVDSDLSVHREVELETDGRVINLGYTISQLEDRSDSDRGDILIFRDITDIKTMSNESKRIERLASLGTLASGIAHEVKNPLAGIKAMAQILEEATEDKLSHYASRIIAQVNRLNELLNSFFSIARQNKSERRFFPVESVIREVVMLVKGPAGKKDVELIFNTSESFEIFSRPDQVQQVLLNLVLNALEAIEAGSTISIEVDPPIVESSRQPIFGVERAPDRWKTQQANSVVVRVVDDGPGIPKEILERVFDPFFTTKETGTGLGLFIVHQLVQDELGGRIEVLSSEEGTVFAVILPTVPSVVEDSTEKRLEFPGTPGFNATDLISRRKG